MRSMQLRKQVNRLNRCMVLPVLMVMMAGCMTPPTNTYQPNIMRPHPQSAAATQPTGAIFQNINSTVSGVRYTPLFEDRRARTIGDTIIVTLNEKTNASKSSDSKAERSGELSFSVPNFFAVPLSLLQKNTSVEAKSANKFDGGGESSSQNDFKGTITVTVIETLPNGNLIVGGEKQIGINLTEKNFFTIYKRCLIFFSAHFIIQVLLWLIDFLHFGKPDFRLIVFYNEIIFSFPENNL